MLDKLTGFKTLIFNCVAMLALLLQEFGYTGQVPDGYEKLVPFILILVNIVLRFMTKTPVGGGATKVE